MKSWSKLLFTAWLCCCAALIARAQPVVGVNITAPANESGAAYTSPVSITAAGVGTGPFTYTIKVNGSIIIQNTTGVATWTPPQPGVYFITSDVTDLSGNPATSLPVRYYATGAVVNSPVSGTLVPQGSTVVLKADAITAAGKFVAQVQFFDNGTAIGTDSTAPYSLIYAVPGAAGSVHSITAVATDNTGALLTSATNTMTVVSPILPLPTTSISSPANGAVITIPTGTAKIPISVDATSSTGRISKVEVYKDGELFATKTSFPYTFNTWQPTVVGSYTLVALTYDDKNNVIASTPAVVRIVPPPTVTVITPTSGSTVIGGSPTPVKATASDSGGSAIQSVQFFVDTVFVGQATQPVAGTTNTYQVTPTLSQKIDPQTGAVIPSTIIALATNAQGSSGQSAAVTVNVTNGGAGGSVPIGNPPTVSLTTPTASTQLPVNRPAFLAATARDTDGNIVSVQFFVNNQSVGTTMSYPYTATWTPASLGNYAITVQATDNDGNTVTSAAVSVSVIDPAPNLPTVAVTDPADGSSVLVGTPQMLRATAADTVGVTSVQFFVNGQPQGTALTAFPFNREWTPTVPGTYVITARATNVARNQATSAPVTVTVSGGTPPTVAITSPSNGATLPVNAAATLSATAISPSASIVSVQFFVNGTSINTDNTFPYSTSWTPASPGTYSLRARATDSVGNFTDATINVTVAGGAAPIVTMTNPATGGTYSVGTTINLTATATDPDGTVTQVQFFVNGIAQGSADTSAPYLAQWTPNAAGTYTITAQATDNTGNVRTSTGAVVAIIANGAPSVAITSPAAGAAVSAGTIVNLTASASDSDGTVVSVRYFVNGNVVGAPATVAPYFTAWAPSAPGTYNIVAEATDNSGNVTNSELRTVTVISNQPPTIALSSPAAGATVSSNTTVNLTANASDSDGSVATVRYFINGNVVGAPATTAPFLVAWTPTATGTYTIVAEAVDNSGNVANSAGRTVTVIANQPPIVSLSSPAAGISSPAGVTVTLTALASDTDGSVTSVRFLANSTVIGTPITTPPYTTAWTPTATGSYAIVAEALDNSGNATTSAPRTVNIVPNALPVATVTAPANGISTIAGLPIDLKGTATDADGTVSRVRFLANGTLVGSVLTAAPYSVTWTPSVAGSYQIVLEATDNTGNIANSTAVNVTVVANNLPVVALTAPANASIVRVGNDTTLTATASDSDGLIKSVQFFVNDALQGSAITAFPYTTTWKPNAEGIYRITAVATDNAGATATSAAVTVKAVTAATHQDTFDTGIIVGAGENGRYAAADLGDKNIVFIGTSTTTAGVTKTYYFSGLPLSANGQFSGAAGGHTVTGTFSETGSFGTLDGNVSFSGSITFPLATVTVPAGLYSGNIAGRLSSLVTAIIGPDGAIAIYIADGAFQAAGFGSVDTTGAFDVLTNTGARFAGKAEPASGFLSGTLTGGPGGTVMAAVGSGAPFSDGSLRNLSTRGQVGLRDNVLIAGFVVGGATPKQVLIRAVGPTLGRPPINFPGVLADPQLQVYDAKGNAIVGLSNNNWGGNAGIAAASSAVGAFPLPADSLDAVLLTTLQPGNYSVQVTDASGGQGVALVEIWDVDSPTPFSAQKILNISTRANVGTGNNILIAGFMVGGNTPKKVLIRGVGPSLGAIAPSLAVLPDPVLRLQRLVDGKWVDVRENDNWETGNDATLVRDAAAKVGAFALQAGSKDAVIMLNLPPGTYSAQVSGAANSTGIAIVEVYEVP